VIALTRVGGLVEIARSLEALIVAEREAAEAQRTLTGPVVDALHDNGVFATFVPREVGGLEVDPLDWLEMVEELSRIDASVGWLAMINAGTFAQFLSVEDHAALKAKTGGRFIVSQNYGRVAGIAHKVDGGYRISGRWPFVSGSPHATWVGGGSVWYDGDEPVIHPEGTPWIINAIWPQTDATLIDTWDGLGLRATGSGDMEVDDLFVPDQQVNNPGQPLAYPLRVQLRQAMIFAVRSAKQAIDLLFESAGSAAVYTGRTLERAHRDITTAANHIIVTETEYTSIGSYHLTKHLEGGPYINGRRYV